MEKYNMLDGTEQFLLNGKDSGFNVLDFWRFQFSNIADMQGRVGEFLVAMALRKEEPDNNNGWTLWDINYNWKRVEVKTTSYYQPWRKDGEYSEVRTFGIQQTYPNEDGNPNTYSENKDKSIKVRNNDLYVFVLNIGKNKEEADPLKLEHWRFFVIPTSVIDNECGSNKTISLNKVKTLSDYPEGLMFDELKDYVDRLIYKMERMNTNRFTDIEGSVITKKDGSQYEFRDGKMVKIREATKK